MVVKVKHSYDIAALAKQQRPMRVLTNRSLSCSKYCCTCLYVNCESILFSKCKKKGFVVVVAEAFNVFIQSKVKILHIVCSTMIICIHLFSV